MRKKRIANCPACAGPVEFRLSTALVTVCEFCHSVVAQAGKNVEDHGKVADLIETQSPLQRGLKGKFESKTFEVVGRVQYQHPAGGVWDEWYLQFSDNKAGWLAAAQGKFYLMFEKRFAKDAKLPSYFALEVGHRFDVPGGGGFTLAEKGIASARSAEGSIPWAFRQGADHCFADLHGENGAFATLEFGEERVRGFFGREVTLAELHLDREGWFAPSTEGVKTGALQVNCPHCAGSLTLHAPDQALRVTCPSCQSLLDCEQGKLKYLQTLNLKGAKPVIPLGSVGKLYGDDYTLIGFMERYAVWQGKQFPWTEYLLYSPTKGFRWLVRNQGHWSFVESVSLSQAKRSTGGRARWGDDEFKLYDKGEAFVRFVVGEFYWRVSTNEVVATEDYISPPRMLSFETSKGDCVPQIIQTIEASSSTKKRAEGQELNASLGTYITVEEIEAAFNLKDLPRPFGVGTIQPQPDRSEIWMLWFGFATVLLCLDVVLSSGTPKKPVSQFHFFMAEAIVAVFPVLTLFARHAFEVNRWSNSDYSPYSSGES